MRRPKQVCRELLAHVGDALLGIRLGPVDGCAGSWSTVAA